MLYKKGHEGLEGLKGPEAVRCTKRATKGLKGPRLYVVQEGP